MVNEVNNDKIKTMKTTKSLEKGMLVTDKRDNGFVVRKVGNGYVTLQSVKTNEVFNQSLQQIRVCYSKF
jgi:hypothetical protein